MLIVSRLRAFLEQLSDWFVVIIIIIIIICLDFCLGIK